MKTEVKIKGMMCNGCTNAVNKKLSSLKDVESVEVQLETGTATLTSQGEIDHEQVVQAVKEAGYEVE